jgi:hypothetical protein
MGDEHGSSAAHTVVENDVIVTGCLVLAGLEVMELGFHGAMIR